MFKLTIRTPELVVYEGEVDSLGFSSDEQTMVIYEDHASIVATITFSSLELEEPDKQEVFLARSGIFTFDNEKNEAKILVSYCQKKSEVDYMTATQYLEFLEKQLEEGRDLSEFQILYLQNERLAIEQQVEESL